MLTLVPDFYKSFSCKCGECRHACCEGWQVEISMSEYFKLLGVNCSARLRKALDKGMRVTAGGGTESYAALTRDMNGSCSLRRPDGLCSVQYELGEGAIPAICRLYPRRPVLVNGFLKCSLANSCEKTVELLLDRSEKITFITVETDIPATLKLNIDKSICAKEISIMQCRNAPIGARIAEMGSVTPERSLQTALPLLKQLYACCRKSRIASDCRDKAESLLCDEATLENALDALSDELPGYEMTLEMLFVNHMFYEDFDGGEDAFLALAAAYALLKTLMAAYFAETRSYNETADFFADAFRFIEHSGFASGADTILRNHKSCVPALLAL